LKGLIPTHSPKRATLLEREIQFQVPDTAAAIIAEPIQGAGGVNVPPANYWPRLREICDRYNILLIADEVITGFGRSGELFGVRNWGVKPDMMCVVRELLGLHPARRDAAQ